MSKTTASHASFSQPSPSAHDEHRTDTNYDHLTPFNEDFVQVYTFRQACREKGGGKDFPGPRDVWGGVAVAEKYKVYKNAPF